MRYYKRDSIYHEANCFAKFAIFNGLCLLFFLPLIILGIISSVSLNKYGLSIQKPFLLPLDVNATRAWFLFLLFLYLFLWSFVIEYAIKYIKLRPDYNVLGILSIFIPFMFIYNVIYGLRNFYFNTFWRYMMSERDEGQQIDHFGVWLWITRQEPGSKVVRNTLIFYATLLSFTIGLGFFFSDYNDGEITNDFFIFSSLSFFTQQNNFLCWIFLMLFLFFNSKMLFKDNTYLLYSASYILIVGVIAIIMIGPYLSYEDHASKFNGAYPITKFIWFHVINPAMFTWFAINSVCQSYSMPKKYLSYTVGFMRYPLFYGLYVYILPFLCNYSVYGELTNINPNMIEEGSKTGGNPAWILGAFAMIIVFIGFGSLMRLISLKVKKNYDTFQVIR